MDNTKNVKRKPNPRETANIFSKLTFLYTRQIFAKSIRQGNLEENDLYEVIKCCNSKHCGENLEEQLRIDKSMSVYKLCWKSFGWRYLLFGVIDLSFKICNNIVQPLAMSTLISYFNPSSDLTKNQAYFWTFILLLNYFFAFTYLSNIIFYSEQLGIEVKTAFSALLYRKALKLAPSAVAQITIGNIVTLITKDVVAFQNSIWMINDIWTGACQVFFVFYLFYNRMGTSSFVGIGVILLVFPIQVYMGKLIGKYKVKTGKLTDERLQETQETLSTIKIIKMYTWEAFFRDKIEILRSKETSKITLTFILRMVQITLGLLFSRMSFYLLIISYMWTGYVTTTELIFYLDIIFRDLQFNLGFAIPFAMGRAAEFYSAAKRIQQVLSAEELPMKGSDQSIDKPVLELQQATVKINDVTVLKNINFHAESGLVLITGKVGSGKSSLLKALLQDYPLHSGDITSRGRISYACQDPWLFPSSIRQNILFGEKYNEERYKEVLRVCALEFDFKLLSKGDETIVSDRGLNLSKGQQARINLARAIYRESEIYLLDDSLTALDSQVQEYIFKECIQNFLKGKICIMVTQILHQLKGADYVIVMEDGEIKSSNNQEQMVLSDISTIIESDSNPEKKEMDINVTDNSINEKSTLLETEQTTQKTVYSEVNKSGEVSKFIYKKYLMYTGGLPFLIMNLVIFTAAQASTSGAEYLLTRWVDQQQIVADLGNITNNSTYLEAKSHSFFTFKIYGMTMLLAAILDILRLIAIFHLARRASVNIHKSVIRRITNACMLFFDTHFIGNILNRFSQDLSNIDEQMPSTTFEVTKEFFLICGIVIMSSMVNPYFLLFVIIITIVLVFTRKLYLTAGRSLKRLETTTRSPMVGHINATLEGLTTIRAYKLQTLLTQEFDRHQDLFTSAHYMWQSTSFAFGFCMEFLNGIFVALVVLSFVVFDTGKSAGDVGLAITQVWSLSFSVQWAIRQWANIESLMTSVERFFEYTQIKEETNQGREISNWPSEGEIVYKNVSLVYNSNETVLKNLNFTVAPKQNIGIVGRTGAGKSSIIASIFRLYETEGNIFIDGVDIKTVSLGSLRKKLAIIPQDPILFSGTIRTNLDPFGEFTDNELWNALDKVNIKYLVPDLDYNVTSYATNFSSGQRQLLSVARAMLRQAKILILDEATANMDKESDIMLNKIIKDNFPDCTVFTIAHRLDTILQSDKVMVLDRGEIVEFDQPAKLLENNDGFFFKLVQQAGLLTVNSS